MRWKTAERPDLPEPETPHALAYRPAGHFPQHRGKYEAYDVMARHWTRRERPPSWYRVYRLADRNAPRHSVAICGDPYPVPQLFIFVQGQPVPLTIQAAFRATQVRLFRTPEEWLR